MLNSYAKVNLTLDVLNKRDDGYHNVKMIMQQCGLCDNITLRKTDCGIMLSTNLAFLPTDRRNIAYKAAMLFFEFTNINTGVDIHIVKHIPVAAGLAGGSGNGAAVLVGLNMLYDTNLSTQTLMNLGKTLGADIPYCIVGGTMLAEGIGEILTPLTPLPRTAIVIVKPPISVSTAGIYAQIDSDNTFGHPNTDAAIDALNHRNVRAVAQNMSNLMENVTALQHPIIGDIKSKLMAAGAFGAVMSGSGPSVFGLFRDFATAKKASTQFNGKYFVYAGWTKY